MSTKQSLTELVEYWTQDDCNTKGPRIIDIAFTAFVMAKNPNSEDGGDSDWMNDTKPTILGFIEQMRKHAGKIHHDELAQVTKERDDLIAAGLKCCNGTPNPDLPKTELALSFIESTRIAFDAANSLWVDYKRMYLEQLNENNALRQAISDLKRSTDAIMNY